MEFVTDGHNTVHTQGLCQPGVKSLCADIQGAVLYQIHSIHDVLNLIILAIPLSKRIIVMLMPYEQDSVCGGEISYSLEVSTASISRYNTYYNIWLFYDRIVVGRNKPWFHHLRHLFIVRVRKSVSQIGLLMPPVDLLPP